MTLHGRTALAIGTRFVKEGARVALVDLDRGGVEAAAAGLGDRTLAVVADVTWTEDVERAVSATFDTDSV